MRFVDSNGVFANYSTAGRFDMDNEFFQTLGTNGRSCATCHRLENGISFTTETVRRLFQLTEGRDPLFARVDGTNQSDADLSTTEKRLEASSLLLNRGVIGYLPVCLRRLSLRSSRSAILTNVIGRGTAGPGIVQATHAPADERA